MDQSSLCSIAKFVDAHGGQQPKRNAEDAEERRLARAYALLKLRRHGARVQGSTKPSDQALSAADSKKFDAIAREQSAASASLTAPMSAEPGPITDGTPAAEAHPGDMSGLEPTRGSTQAMRDDMEWLGSDPGFLKDLAFDTDEAKEETRLYYDALKMLFCYLRGSWSEKTTCRLEQRLGKEFFEGQLRDVYLNSQAVAQKLNEQNPVTVKTITDMIVSTPTEELDALLELLGELDQGAEGSFDHSQRFDPRP
jgi:hypothetical protein